MRAIPGELAVMAEQVTGRGARGVVAAAAPAAARIGAATLAEGGNAFDAAVAAALAETVLLPPKCGLGGDLIAIVVPAGADQPEALVAVGGAPAGLAGVARAGGWSDVGPNSVGPPAAGAGYAALASRGVMGRDRLARDAIELAVGGFAWADVCARLSAQAAELVADMHPEGTVYYPGGTPLLAGSLTRLPGLGRALSQWAERGAAFLEGPVGAAIVAAVAARGGALTTADLRFATAEWRSCSSADVAGRTCWTTPAPTHGGGLLNAIADYADTDGGTPALYSSVIGAIARQRDALGDPGGTSIVSAADSDGNVVMVVHSNSYPRFGSGIVVPEFDLPLANRAGRGFTPVDGHPNFPHAGQRPATTLHAWVLSDERRRPRWVGGTPGGANQLPWNAQTLAALLAGERRPGVLVAGPLWEWLPDDDGVRIELGFDDEASEALRAAAPRAVSTHRWGCKSARQVIRIPDAGDVWEAAADPRTVGLALGV